MSATKTLRYSPKPRSKPRAKPAIDPLLVRLRKLASKKNDPLTLRELRESIPPVEVYALLERCPTEIQIIGDGRSHRILLRKSNDPPFLVARTIPPALPIPVTSAPVPTVAPIPDTDVEPTTFVSTSTDEYIARMTAELRGTRSVSNRLGGRSRGLIRIRKPMVDTDGTNLELVRAQERLTGDGSIGRRYGRYAAVMREMAAKGQLDRPAVHPPRHLQKVNGGAQRPQAPVKSPRGEPQPLRHLRPENRGMRQTQITTVSREEMREHHHKLPTG